MNIGKHIRVFSDYMTIGPILNKSIEAQILHRRDNAGFDYSLRLNTKGDHPGLHLSIEYNGYGFYLAANDCRHWNWDEDRFYLDDEEVFPNDETTPSD